MLFSCPDHGQKLAEGGNQEQTSLWVRRSYIINKSASEQSGAFLIPKNQKGVAKKMAEETKQPETEQPEKTYSAAEYTALQEQLDAARL